MPIFDRDKYAPAGGLARGAYILADSDRGAPHVILIGTGSEVQLCIKAYEALKARGIGSRVVSMPSSFFVPELGQSQAEVNFTNADQSAIWVHNGRPAGRWNYDVSGRLIGFFSELSAPSIYLTNTVGIATNVAPDACAMARA